MTIGIIGAGAIGQAVATRVARAGLSVLISNSRGPESLDAVVRALGSGAQAVTTEETAVADIVVLAVPWSSLPAALSGLPAWEGRIVVDATNPLSAPDYQVADLGGKTSSEVVARLVPGARLVKAFNTLPPALLINDPPEGKRILFLSGDDTDANTEISRLLSQLGFAGITLGGLVAGGSLHQFPGGPLAAQNLVRFPLR